jgi:hypothetical protein
VLLKISQPSGPATKWASDVSEALGKGSTDAAAIQTVKAASREMDCHRTTLRREIVQHALIKAVNTMGRSATDRAFRRCWSRHRLEG